MAWDTERTRRLLLEAATRHFAASGLAGSRIDAIAREAGVNKERIYQYFGDKEGLFTAVLVAALKGLFDAAEMRGTGPGAVGAYAGRLFDHYIEHPEFPRLVAWESLERSCPVAYDERAAACGRKVGAIRTALPGIDEAAARHLLVSLATLTTGWWSLAQLPAVMLGGPVPAAQRKAAVVAQVTHMARAAQEAAAP